MRVPSRRRRGRPRRAGVRFLCVQPRGRQHGETRAGGGGVGGVGGGGRANSVFIFVLICNKCHQTRRLKKRVQRNTSRQNESFHSALAQAVERRRSRLRAEARSRRAGRSATLIGGRAGLRGVGRRFGAGERRPAFGCRRGGAANRSSRDAGCAAAALGRRERRDECVAEPVVGRGGERNGRRERLEVRHARTIF